MVEGCRRWRADNQMLTCRVESDIPCVLFELPPGQGGECRPPKRAGRADSRKSLTVGGECELLDFLPLRLQHQHPRSSSEGVLRRREGSVAHFLAVRLHRGLYLRAEVGV